MKKQEIEERMAKLEAERAELNSAPAEESCCIDENEDQRDN